MLALQRKRSIHDPDEDLVSKRTCSAVPDFECSAYHLGQVKQLRLSHLLNEYNTVVFFFYERDFTAQALQDVELVSTHHDHFTRLGALPVMISTDHAMVHYGFCTSPKGLDRPPPFPLFGDITRSVSRLFDTLDLSTGNARRAVYIVNQQRLIQSSFSSLDDTCYSIPAILSALSS